MMRDTVIKLKSFCGKCAFSAAMLASAHASQAPTVCTVLGKIHKNKIQYHIADALLKPPYFMIFI